MKFSFLTLCLLLLASCSKQKSEEEVVTDTIISVSEVAVPYYQNNYKKLNLNGKVKEIFCTDYVQFVSDSYSNTYIVKNNYKFDTLGNVIEKISLLKDDKFSSKKVYFYDRMNNVLKTLTFFEANDMVTESKKDSLNKQGLFVSSDYFHKDKGSKSHIQKYEIISDTIIKSVLYTIEKGIVIDSLKEIKKYENGHLVYWFGSVEQEYKYDKNGNKIFQVLKDKRDTLVYHIEYDENNREVKWGSQKNGEIRLEILKSYDTFGNIIREVYYDRGEISDLSSYYDILTYDNKNNWIKRERFKLNGDKISILERKITYY